MTQLVKNVLKIFIVPQNIHKQIWFSNSWKLICFQLKQTDQWLSSVTAVNKHFISNRRINRNHGRNNYFHTYVYKKKRKRAKYFCGYRENNIYNRAAFSPAHQKAPRPVTFDVTSEGKRQRQSYNYKKNKFKLCFYWRVKSCWLVLTGSHQSPASHRWTFPITACSRKIHSSYWSFLNFFGPTGLLETEKKRHFKTNIYKCWEDKL